MCVLFSAWLCMLLGLLPLETQSRALTPTHRHRHQPLLPDLGPPVPPVDPVMDNHLPGPDPQLLWRALLHQEPPRTDHPTHAVSAADLDAPGSRPRGSRGRRHVNSVGGRGHLMRVGCVLGTCQVQNLSHRLYQLIGQSGREDSSPINPRSPHSYG